MNAPRAISSLAALAGGKKMRVVDASGKEYFMTPEDPASMEADRLELDQQIRATLVLVTALVHKLDESMAAMAVALAQIHETARAQAEYVKVMRELSETMKLPLEPVYGASGKLIGARRVPKLKG